MLNKKLNFYDQIFQENNEEEEEDKAAKPIKSKKAQANEPSTSKAERSKELKKGGGKKDQGKGKTDNKGNKMNSRSHKIRKTKKGQPVMKDVLKNLMHKIEKNVGGKKAKNKQGK
eukprot:TRINITY_DN7973_c0_g1_i4.p2 TRINITY_DN7973_c0_g1~~TRINITY_DN7973_c0_g1_i4.p2  ORF type:complete len:115 (-),score=43.46 TRINITY_DN7973_c0_g1_i4:251-595(-)